MNNALGMLWKRRTLLTYLAQSALTMQWAKKNQLSCKFGNENNVLNLFGEHLSLLSHLSWLCHSVKVGEYFTKYSSSNWGLNHKSNFLLWLATSLRMGYGLTSPYWHRQSVDGQTFLVW